MINSGFLTKPFNKVLKEIKIENNNYFDIGQAHTYLCKSANDPETAHSLSGRLYATRDNWILLSVPNSLVRGAFDALHEPGIELPYHNNKLNAHISVMSPEDIEHIGGIDKITERGHQFHYTLGPIRQVVPKNWRGVSKVWFIEVKSKELQDLRKSYGLSPTPNDGKFSFQITIAKRMKNVLKNNNLSKSSEEKNALSILPLARNALLASNIITTNRVNALKRKFEELDEEYYDLSHLEQVENLPVELDIEPQNVDSLILFRDKEDTDELKPTDEQLQLLKNKSKQNSLFNIFNTKSGGIYGLLENEITQGNSYEKKAWGGYNRIGSKANTAQGLQKENSETRYCQEVWKEFCKIAEVCGTKEAKLRNNKFEFSDLYEAPVDYAKQKVNKIESKIEEIYSDLDSGKLFPDTSPGRLTIDDLYKIPSRTTMRAARTFANIHYKLYKKFEERYGPRMAKTILAVWLAAAPLPGPMSPVVAAPLIGAGEIMHFLKERANKKRALLKQNKTAAYKIVDKKKDKKKDRSILENFIRGYDDESYLLNILKGLGISLGSRIYTAGVLRDTYNKKIPVQVTKFPGLTDPLIIRGPVTPNSPASTIEATTPDTKYLDDKAYLFLGHDFDTVSPGKHVPLTRVHGSVDSLEDVLNTIKDKLKDRQLGYLEYQAHGGPGYLKFKADLDASDPKNSLNYSNVEELAKTIRQFVSNNKNKAIFFAGGCNTGTCDLEKKLTSGKKLDWLQDLSEQGNVEVIAPRGFYNVIPGSALTGTVRALHNNRPLTANPHYNEQSEEGAIRRYRGKDDIKTELEKRTRDKSVLGDDYPIKNTFIGPIDNSLWRGLYSGGKMLSYYGAPVIPLLYDKKLARNTAAAITAFSAPYVISELLTRLAEARGRLAYNRNPTIYDTGSTYLDAGYKLLPTLALASAPLLSYSIADLLGRWKDNNNEKSDITEE